MEDESRWLNGFVTVHLGVGVIELAARLAGINIALAYAGSTAQIIIN